MSTGLMDKLLDVVEAAEFERADEEFVSVGLGSVAWLYSGFVEGAYRGVARPGCLACLRDSAGGYVVLWAR